MSHFFKDRANALDLRSLQSAVLWEWASHDTGALFFVKWDAEDGALGAKDHAHCPHATCSVVMHIALSDGAPQCVWTLCGVPTVGKLQPERRGGAGQNAGRDVPVSGTQQHGGGV